MVAKGEVLVLYRSLLRTARQFPDYNIREYAKRRTVDGFHDSRKLSEPSAISAAFSDGKAQLEVAKRQAVVYSLYAPKIKSVMEVIGKVKVATARSGKSTGFGAKKEGNLEVFGAKSMQVGR